MKINDQVYTYIDCQVLEYQPESLTWKEVGNLQYNRSRHASLTIGTQHLPCLSGENDDYGDLDGKWDFFMKYAYNSLK